MNKRSTLTFLVYAFFTFCFFWAFYILGALLIGGLNFFGVNIPAAALGVTFGPTISRPEETQMIGAYLTGFRKDNRDHPFPCGTPEETHRSHMGFSFQVAPATHV
mgnify:CR=1 FL=1